MILLRWCCNRSFSPLMALKSEEEIVCSDGEVVTARFAGMGGPVSEVSGWIWVDGTDHDGPGRPVRSVDVGQVGVVVGGGGGNRLPLH